MNASENSENLATASAPKKTWSTPEVRDQGIKSLTEGKPGSASHEVSSDVGPS